jgi:uncharacterized protein (TIGR02246 family)
MKKKTVLSIALAMALAGVPGFAGAADSNDAAIKNINQDFVTAWNAHDPKRMAAVWADDVDLINPFGVRCSNRAEVERLFEREQSGVMKSSTYRIDAFTLRRACDDVMVGDWEATVTGMIDPGGNPIPPFSHHVTTVYQNRGGHWTATLVRAFQPLPPPGPPSK